MDVTNLSPAQLRKAADLKERFYSLNSELASLLGGNSSLNPQPLPPKAGRRQMSAAGRARIAAAARARWAKVRGATVSARSAGRRTMSAAGRAKSPPRREPAGPRQKPLAGPGSDLSSLIRSLDSVSIAITGDPAVRFARAKYFNRVNAPRTRNRNLSESQRQFCISVGNLWVQRERHCGIGLTRERWPTAALFL